MNKINSKGEERVKEIFSIGLDKKFFVSKKAHLNWIYSYLHLNYCNSLYKSMHDSWEIFGEGLRKLNRLATISYRKECEEHYVFNKKMREAQVRYLEKRFYVLRQAECFKEQAPIENKEESFSAYLLLASPA